MEGTPARRTTTTTTTTDGTTTTTTSDGKVTTTTQAGDGGGGGGGGDSWGLVTKALTALAGGVSLAAFVTVVGGALYWIRFKAVGLPADQATAAVPNEEMVTTGLSNLIPFLALAVVALVLLYMIDREGKAPTDAPRENPVSKAVESLVSAEPSRERREDEPAGQEPPAPVRFANAASHSWGRAALLLGLMMGAFYALVPPQPDAGDLAFGALLLVIPIGFAVVAPGLGGKWPIAIVGAVVLLVWGLVLSIRPGLTEIAWWVALGGAVLSLGVAAQTDRVFRWFGLTAFFLHRRLRRRGHVGQDRGDAQGPAGRGAARRRSHARRDLHLADRQADLARGGPAAAPGQAGPAAGRQASGGKTLRQRGAVDAVHARFRRR